jgi:alanine-glyoxylate transaminase/serine-glyoxylate transaminase/serine-pyruvate transaminase
LFGQRMVDVAQRCGAEVVAVEAPWGTPIDPEALLGAHPSPAIVAVVHAETSTGVRNDVDAVARDKGDALLLADCVTSLCGISVDVDGWGVDIAYSGTQKCIGVAPGLAPVTFGERALARRVERPQSWYLDIGMITDYTSGTAGGRRYHHTAPVAMVQSLHAGLGVVLEEGLDAVWARHAEAGRLLQDGLEAMGLELWATEGHRLPELTTVKVPEGVESAAVRRTLLERYDIEIGAGVGPWADQVWRIGIMGHNARPAPVATVLAALGEILGRHP